MRIVVLLPVLLAAASAVAATPDFAALAARHEAATLADRRWLHQHPGAVRAARSATRAYLLERLREIPGVKMVEGDWGLGLVAVLGGAPRPAR